MAVVAITLGALIIVPPFVSTYRTFKRIGTAEDLASVSDRVSPGLGFLLYLVALIFLPPVEQPYAQAHLNGVWRHLTDAAV